MDSVLKQTYPNIEYIIIDGNSKDGTLQIVESKAKADVNLKWISEPDSGIYDALNKGIVRATGDIIGFVHSDDYLAEPTTIEKIVTVFESEAVDGVYGNLHYVAFDNPETVIRNWTSQTFQPRLLNRGWMPAHPTLFLKRQVYLDKGHFNLKYKIAADYDFILRVFKDSKYRFYFLPNTITKMRIGGASNKSLKNLIQKTKEDYWASKSNGLFLPLKVILIKNLSKIPQWLKK